VQVRHRRGVRLILLSPPGAGKGTHAALLSAATGVRHVSSGDVLRAEVSRGTELGRRLEQYTSRGDLVPDDLIFEILLPVVVEAARSTGGFLLDGFPRTVPQAKRAAQLGVELELVADAAVFLTAPREELVSRLLSRAEREGRADDTTEVIEHRLSVFESSTRPLVAYYRDRGILLEVDADRPMDVVQDDLRVRLGITPA
jgi:adenylate kinase